MERKGELVVMAFGLGKKNDGEARPKRGFFSKKNKDADNVEVEEEEVVSTGSRNKGNRPRKKGKNDMMASVLKETVKTAVLADMKANERFQVRRGSETYYVGWLLDVDDIGGLSRKTRSDEAKGSIIEGINKGSIKVLITAALMADEKICFVPDADTLDMMAEFSILANAPYKTMFISAPDGEVINLDGAVDVSLADAFKVLQGDVRLEDLLADYGCYWASGGTANVSEFGDDDMVVDEGELVDEDEIVPETAASPATPVPPAGVPAERAVGDLSGLVEFDFDNIDIDEQSMNAQDIARQAQPSSFERNEPQQAPQQSEPVAQVAEKSEETVVDSSDYRRLLSRRWYSTDLNLEVDMDTFEAQFNTDAPFAIFDDNRPVEGSWMGEYLNQMAREANDDLKAIHNGHIAQLRDRYQRMLSSYIAAVNDVLAMNVNLEEGDFADNTYAEEFDALKRIRQEQRSEIEMLASKERNRLEEMYQQRRDMAMATASNRRAQEFDQRYRDECDRKKGNVETHLRAQFDEQYNEGYRRLNDRRVEEAYRRMDYGVTAILADLSAQYEKMLEIERERYEHHRNAMSAWIDENRRQDIDFVAATREEQRQQEKSEIIAREMTEKMHQQQLEFEQRKRSLEDDLSQLRRRNEEALEEAKATYTRTLAEIEEENTRLRKREEDLLNKYKSLDDEKSMEYSRRMKELEDQLEAERLRYDALMHQGKRSNIVWIAFIAVSAIAAGCVGVVFGLHQSIDYSMATSATGMLMGDWTTYMTLPPC